MLKIGSEPALKTKINNRVTVKYYAKTRFRAVFKRTTYPTKN